MTAVPGYTVTETIYIDEELTLERGVRDQDRLPVLLKSTVSKHPPIRVIERIEHEYSLRGSLDPAWAVRPIELLRYPDGMTLVLEDFSGNPLDIAFTFPMDLSQFLNAAISTSSAMAGMHTANIVHKDINPRSILIDASTCEVKFTGFGSASLASEQQTVQIPGVIEGNLPYISPEQTGRMNRPFDYRTDMYSFGVTLYQMLTGELPSTAKDPLELVYAHIAITPTPPSKVLPRLPEVVSDIDMKLVSKVPDERYQSALGLKSDLERCRAQLETTGRIESFPLGEQDIPEKLQIPQKLYGREMEIARLIDTFAQVMRDGNPALMLVSGYSGIGKSSLVRELYRPAVKEHGFFISGKFDQYKRNIPYSTIIQAFQELVQQILSESEEDIAEWRQCLHDAIGINGQLIVDIIPQIELIIGAQAPVVELPPTEAQNRFNYVFRQLVGVFATREHPLVVFLDDLQWADAASLKLMEYIITSTDTKYLLIVGAYRDNEVDPAHPLTFSVENIRREGARTEEIHLSEISFEALGQFIADILHSSEARVEPLTQLIYEKTSGNPFFVIQLLGTIHHEGLVWFNRESLAWGWDIGRITAVGFTDNVADLMVTRLEGLPEATRDMLKIAAAVGNQFDVHTLSVVNEKPEEEMERELQSLVNDRLILQSGGIYKFAHDRIQQAAYSLIPMDNRGGVHLGIGRLLLVDTLDCALDESVFDMVNQFNQGSALIDLEDEMEIVAELNLAAGRRAKASAAFASAVAYFSAGISILPEGSWESLYDLTYALHLERAECEFLSGSHEEAEESFPSLLARARTNMDKSKIYHIKISLHITKGENDIAVASGIECLKLFGITLSAHPTRDEMLKDYNLVWSTLGDRSIESLIDLPRMEDPEKIAALNTLSTMTPASYFSDANLRYLTATQMVNLSLQHGNSDASSHGYNFFGLNLGPIFNKYEEGYRFGRLAIDLIDRDNIIAYRGRVYYDFANQTNIWSRSIKSSLDYMNTAYDVLLEVGDFTYACYCGNNIVTLRRVKGDPLPEVYQSSEKYLAFAQKVRYDVTKDIIIDMQRLIRNLQGLTSNFSTFSDDEFDEDEHEAKVLSYRMPIAICWHYILKLQARFMSGDYDKALEAANSAEPLLWSTLTAVHHTEFRYYYALVLSSIYDQASDDEKNRYLEVIKSSQAHFAEWSENCPENFRHGYLLLSAELANVTGDDMEAMQLYDSAIKSAKANGFIQNEGIGNELAARFYLKRGFEVIAKAYMREARYCYQRWRADGKVKQLDQLYPQLLERSTLAVTPEMGVSETHLDVMTVAKASQAISSEIDLSRLLDTLMKIMVEQAGAEKGYLLLAHEGGFTIDVEARVESGEIKVAMPESTLSMSALPGSILNYVTRTKEMVLLDDARSPNPFSEDAYIVENRPKSVLCLPIVRQTDLVGMLYIENNLVSGAFTTNKITVLELLSSQAAISLQNAMEYAKRRQAEESLRELTQNLERRVTDRTSQLEVTNKELEAFSYSVSHDLRAPLRRIDGFSQAILEDYSDKLDETGQDYIRRVRASTQQMGLLIDDLLRLSRVTRAEMYHESVNMSDLAEEVIASLRASQPERSVEVSIQPKVKAHGDRGLLRIILENLLSNAWKFTGKKPLGRIEFGVTEESGEKVYYVRDNGAGFDMAYADKLFTPFQRLHDALDFPGTGIGLAIVQRIVHRHGGRAWAEGKVDEGATFYFTLA